MCMGRYVVYSCTCLDVVCVFCVSVCLSLCLYWSHRWVQHVWLHWSYTIFPIDSCGPKEPQHDGIQIHLTGRGTSKGFHWSSRTVFFSVCSKRDHSFVNTGITALLLPPTGRQTVWFWILHHKKSTSCNVACSQNTLGSFVIYCL